MLCASSSLAGFTNSRADTSMTFLLFVQRILKIAYLILILTSSIIDSINRFLENSESFFTVDNFGHHLGLTSGFETNDILAIMVTMCSLHNVLLEFLNRAITDSIINVLNEVKVTLKCLIITKMVLGQIDARLQRVLANLNRFLNASRLFSESFLFPVVATVLELATVFGFNFLLVLLNELGIVTKERGNPFLGSIGPSNDFVLDSTEESFDLLPDIAKRPLDNSLLLLIGTITKHNRLINATHCIRNRSTQILKLAIRLMQCHFQTIEFNFGSRCCSLLFSKIFKNNHFKFLLLYLVFILYVIRLEKLTVISQAYSARRNGVRNQTRDALIRSGSCTC